MAAAARVAVLNPHQGYGIRIGSTLEYLLRGMPFKVMKVKGRWASDAFLVYLTQHYTLPHQSWWTPGSFLVHS